MEINRLKVGLVFFFASVYSILIAIQAFKIQVVGFERLDQKLETQLQVKVISRPKRGRILDRNEKVIAYSERRYSLFADPKLIQRASIYSVKLATALNVDENFILQKLKTKGRFVWIKRFLTYPEYERVKKFNLQGLGFVQEDKRIYPFNSLAQDVIGRTDVDNKGISGLEYQFEKLLSGNTQELILNRDGRGRSLFNTKDSLLRPEDGKDIQLAIDITLQEYIYSILQTSTPSLWKAAAVMDASNGEVIALVNESDSRLGAKNFFMTNSFEPGSTVKAFTIAFALAEGVISPRSMIETYRGKYKLGKHLIREAHEDFKYDQLSVTDILKLSSNIGSSKIAQLIGQEKIMKWYASIGYPGKTGMEFPGEVNGFFNPKKKWGDLITSTVGFGHGMMMSGAHLLKLYGILANQGKNITPTLIKREEELEKSQILPAHVVEQVNSMLRTVVASEEGTGKLAQVRGYEVAGKTGTAQKINPATGRYELGKYMASFAGFVPYDQPRYVIVALIDEPAQKYYGSQVAAPIFQKIAQYLLIREGLEPTLEINPDQPSPLMAETEAEPIALPEGQNLGNISLIGLNLREANKILQKCCAQKVELTWEGSGNIYEQQVYRSSTNSAEIHVKLKP